MVFYGNEGLSMSRKKLFMKNPVIWSLPTYGDLFSIISDDVMPWIYNNFIQLEFSKLWGIFAFENHHVLLESCPAIEHYSLAQDMILRESTITSFILEMIDMNYYILLTLDRFYIPCYEQYEKQHFYHEVFVFGYDMEMNKIYFADNLKNGRYAAGTCTFTQLKSAYEAVNCKYGFEKDIHLFRRKTEYSCVINEKQIIDSLHRYLESKNSFYVNSDHECDFGIDIFHDLLSDKEKKVVFDTVDIRPFHLLYEHKVLMRMRIEYLQRNQYLSASFDTKKIIYLERQYLILRNFVMKGNIKRITKLEKTSEMLEQNLQYEKQILGDFLRCLEQEEPRNCDTLTEE